MPHDQWIEKLFALHDGELPASERAATEAHRDSCSECRILLEQWRLTSAGFSRLTFTPGSEAFVQSVLARLPDQPAPVFGGVWKRWVFSAAGLLVLVAAARYQRSAATLPADSYSIEDATRGSTFRWAVSGEEPTPGEWLGLDWEAS